MSTRLPLYRNPLHQLVAGSTWRAAWFLLAYLVWGWLLWTAVFAATLTAAVLCITLAGIPLLVAAAGVIRGCANAERWRLREVLAEPIHGGYRAVQRPGILGQVRTRWTDPAIWRDFAYLFVLFPLLWAVDLAVLVVWLVLLAGITVPLWYWAPARARSTTGSPAPASSSATSRTARAGPGPGAGSWATLHQALIAAAVFLVLFLLFNYVLVGTARLHTRIASALLRAPADPMAEAKEVLTKPGPLGPLHPEPQPAEPLPSQRMHPAN